ncbi:hypothetical protein K2X89_15150, partial [Myxococcota bacterium]|nr:hypothetical protein [Myxococcota bacterium]
MSHPKRRFILILVLVVVGMLLGIPAARSVLGALGIGVRWENAYEAFGMRQWSQPHAKGPSDIERAELALVDEELARDLDAHPRLHAPGTLATLRYESLGVDGEVLDRWRVRAIVPMLGGGEAESIWDEGCPPACQQALEKMQGIRLTGPGAAGLETERILRMPVGTTTEIPAQDLVTQDAFDSTRKQIRLRSYTEQGQSISVPVRVRVTLVEACEADISVGHATELELAPFAIVPIPMGFRERSWVQMNGCRPAGSEPAAMGADDSPSTPEPIFSRASDRAPLLLMRRDGAL